MSHDALPTPDEPVLCLHGGPGFTHYYLEPLEALADRRRVIFYDQLGCGRVIREHEAAGFTGCPEYHAAILGFYRKHVCRLNPWPAGLERSFAGGIPGRHPGTGAACPVPPVLKLISATNDQARGSRCAA